MFKQNRTADWYIEKKTHDRITYRLDFSDKYHVTLRHDEKKDEFTAYLFDETADYTYFACFPGKNGNLKLAQKRAIEELTKRIFHDVSVLKEIGQALYNNAGYRAVKNAD